jgi:hypothetical protein
MMFRIIFPVCFLIATNSGSHQVETDKSDKLVSVESAFDILCNEFVLYWNDYKQMTAFLVLLESEDQKEKFVELLNKSKTGIGEFYALLGLYECDRDQYANTVHSINLSKRVEVTTFRGVDYFWATTLGELKTEIENGRWIENVNRYREVQLPIHLIRT